MPVHRVTRFRDPHSLEEVFEALSKPRDFFLALPLAVEFKAFRGSDVVVYLSAFGFRGDAVFSFVVTKRSGGFTIESSLIGELIMGFFRPPRMDLSFRLEARRIDGGTDIAFEVYFKTSSLRERLSGVSQEVDMFISRIPLSISAFIEKARPKPVAETPQALQAVEVAVRSATTPPSEVTEARMPETWIIEERIEQKTEPAGAPPVIEEKKLAIRDVYSDILEDPIAVYRLSRSGTSVTTLTTTYSTSLMRILSDISRKQRSIIYAVLRCESYSARLLIEGTEILGALLEYGGQALKGEKALRFLDKLNEQAICAVFAISRESLETLKP